ncbi:hypothetical protein FRC00_002662 [Tulasnella sp. 408]|nr:hypothetical protein FRC00_002662 [Tulasnella sp. 408]
MKLLAVIILVLAFGPCLLANVLSGHHRKDATSPLPPAPSLTVLPVVPAPTPVYPTKTFTDACTIRKATIHVPPTSVVVLDHNNVGEFGALPITSFYGEIFSAASSISILTASPVPSTLASIGHVAFAPKLAHQVQMFWNGFIHWWQHDLGRLIEQLVVFYVYMWPFLVAAVVLLRKQALDRPNVTNELVAQFEPTPAPLAWIAVSSVEGILLQFSYTTESPENAHQWTGLWVPRRSYAYYLSNGPADHEADLNTAVSGLLDILLQSVSSYHPWAPQLAGNRLVVGPTPLHASEPTVQPDSPVGGEFCSRRKPHFRPAISRFGGPPAKVAIQFFAPKREYVLVDWIKIASEEGVIIIYGYSTTSIGSLTKWTFQYFPRHPHAYYLSDRPANLDSLLLGTLLRSIPIYHPWEPELDGVLIDMAGETVEGIPVIASTNSEVDVEMDTPPRPDSKPNTPDFPSVIDTTPTSVDDAESSTDIGLEAPLPLSLKDTNNAAGFDSSRVQASSTLPLPPLAPRPPALNSSWVWNRSNAAAQPPAYAFPAPMASTYQVHPSPFGPPVGSSFQSPRVLPSFNNNTFVYQHGQQVCHPYTSSLAYQHGPNVYHLNGTSPGYQHTPTPYHPYTTPTAYQHLPTAYHQNPNHIMVPQAPTVQQVAAVRQEVRPLLPLLAERASQRQGPGWATGSTGFREEAMAEEGLELEEAAKKKFRRGGKRITARKHRWEELERQRREEDPDGGASSMGPH